MKFLVFLNLVIFLVLSGIHFYWAFGGSRGLAASLPTLQNGSDRVLNPGIIATLIVAFGLLFLCVLTLARLGIFPVSMTYVKYTMLGISIVFFLRAFGDFRYVGITKKIRHTEFATNDNRIFIPICLVIGTISLALFWW